MATLLDLPTELLLDILKRNGTRILDLYPIAAVSRRLNSIAIPLAFPDIDIFDLQDILSLTFDGSGCHLTPRPKQEDPLEAYLNIRGADDGLLLLAFDIASVNEIRCIFLDPLLETCAIFQNLTRLAHFLERLTAVRAVTLWFKMDDEYHYALPDFQFTFPTSIADILNHIFQLLAIKGCKHLSIYNGTYGTLAPPHPVFGATAGTIDTNHVLSRHAAGRAINMTAQHLAHHTHKTGLFSKLASRLTNSSFREKIQKFAAFRNVQIPPSNSQLPASICRPVQLSGNDRIYPPAVGCAFSSSLFTKHIGNYTRALHAR